MNSGSPVQATWRTADGSAWWLRSAKHTQPNGDGYTMDDGTKPHGDYQANCYMNVLGSANEDSIDFDDDGCNVHSSSYYCQSVKTTTTTTPVPPPAPPAPTPAPTPAPLPAEVECAGLSGTSCKGVSGWHATMSLNAGDASKMCVTKVAQTSGTSCNSWCKKSGLDCLRAQ